MVGLRQKTTKVGIKSGPFAISLRSKGFRASSSLFSTGRAVASINVGDLRKRHLKSEVVLSNFIALLPTRSISQMLAILSEADF